MADIEAGKSRTGCKACKERKVKVSSKSDFWSARHVVVVVKAVSNIFADLFLQCDEEKPVCRKCRVHFTNVTECDYGQAHEQDAASPSDSDSQRANRVLVPPPRPQPKLLSKNPVVVPPRSVSPSMLDPFSSHPPCEEPDIDMLMETCKSEYHDHDPADQLCQTSPTKCSISYHTIQHVEATQSLSITYL